MSQVVNKRVYLLPVILFVLLTAFFLAVGSYFQSNERKVEYAQAQNITSQVIANLQSLSEEHSQGLRSIMLNWPTQQPNYLDWFNVQAITLLGIQPGYSSLMYVSNTGSVNWLVRPSYEHEKYWPDSAVGKQLQLPELLNSKYDEQYISQIVTNQNGQTFVLLGRVISPQEPRLGYILSTFDLNSWVAKFTGVMRELQYSYELVDLETNRSMVTVENNNGKNVIEVNSEPFQIFDRQWQLRLTSTEQAIGKGRLVAAIGMVMSLVAVIVLYKFLTSAMKLDRSQHRYKTASEAGLDALLIYQRRDQDYFLVEHNKIAAQLFRGDVCNLKDKSLSHQLAVFNQLAMLNDIEKVIESDVPFDGHIEVKSRLISPDWLQVQVVRAGEDIAITLRDVTERFKAKRDLQRSEEKYRRLIDGLHRHFVYTKTPSQTFIYVSNGIQSILGVAPKEFCVEQSHIIQSTRIGDSSATDAKPHSRKNPDPYTLELVDVSGNKKIIEFADNYVFEPNSYRLIAIEGIARDVTAEFALQEAVNYQASHDQLTGLMNRFAFDKYLTALIRQIDNNKATAVMCFIDMDRFKLVNDTCGHPAGDRLLKEVALLFGDYVGQDDLLARIGGDEFCMIFRNLTLEQVLNKLDKILQQVSSYRFVFEEQAFFVGASIGVIEIEQPGFTAAEMIKAADNACYKAKSMGRNRYFIYTPTEEQQALDQVESKVLQRFQNALQNNGFELFFQPIVNLKNANSTIQGEVLLRLIGDDGEYISPGIFIPLAEQHGIMNKIDWWVVENTVAFLHANPHICREVEKIAINLSGITLSDEKMLNQIKHLIQASTIPNEKLCFEITETSAVTNLQAAKWFIDQLRSLGCRFALDDFGAGMSSFTYLKNLNVDYVKIDGSFVRNMVRDKIDYETVKSINNIAQSMGKQTIAEFVVDEPTKHALIDLGIDYGQGYALGYPEPLKNIESSAKLPKTLNLVEM